VADNGPVVALMCGMQPVPKQGSDGADERASAQKQAADLNQKKRIKFDSIQTISNCFKFCRPLKCPSRAPKILNKIWF
jgi:hypothetical protein